MSARFNQVAISVADREVSLAFYRDLFDLNHVGGTHFSGKATEAVQGMKGASSNCSWLMDDRPYFQFEIFQFDCPLGRTLASNRQPQDIGYSRLIFSVPALAPVAARAGVEILELHGKRTLYLRDPDGIAVQIIEADVPQARLTGVLRCPFPNWRSQSAALSRVAAVRRCPLRPRIGGNSGEKPERTKTWCCSTAAQ
jgi:catechol 2,3-dioxygenase-like lactoylglutathione lyase family enzyme